MKHVNEEKIKKDSEHARREPISKPLAHTRTLTKNVFIYAHRALKNFADVLTRIVVKQKQPACLDPTLE